MKYIWSKKSNTKNKWNSPNIILFLRYAYRKGSPWAILLPALIIINASVGICSVFIPRWILVIIQKNRGAILYIAFSITMIELILFLLKAVGTVLKNNLTIAADELFRNAYADLGISQSQIRYEESISPSNLELLESARYGIWEIPSLSNKLEKFGSSVVLLVVNCVIIISHDWRYLIIPAVGFLLLVPLYNFVNQIELDNAQRLLPENRAFGWYCKLISDFRTSEDIRINQGEAFITGRCRSLMDKIYAVNQKSFSKKGLYLGIIKFIFQFQIIATAIILGYSFTSNALEIENFVLMFSAISAISSAGNEIVTGFSQVKKTGILLSPFFSLQRHEFEIHKPKQSVTRKEIHELKFENISFSYPGSTKRVLDHVSFSISAGEHVGIVGMNGAGKSTIAKLMCRLYTPKEGRILIDGVDITAVPEDEYCNYIAALFQDFQLLPVKLIENVIAKNHKEITKEERSRFLKLLRSTNLNQWVSSLASKEDTCISPDLSKDYIIPSGGQAQFLAMLRVVFKDAPVCLFDEPTMALDSDNEKAVMRLMDELNGKICIMISHRLFHMKMMDRIIVLKDGKIVESGTHDALISENGLYKRMYARQALKYEVELS